MKAIENEYRKQISQDIPDLWARIEAGVDEYERTKSSDEISVVSQTATDSSVLDNKVVDINRKKTIVTISKILGAVACIALAATVVFNFGGRTKNETASVQNTMADSAVTEAGSYEAPQEYYESDACETAEVAEETESVHESDRTEGISINKEQSIKADSAQVSEENVIADVINDEAESKLLIMEVTGYDELVVERILDILEECGVSDVCNIEMLNASPLDSSIRIDAEYWNEQTELYLLEVITQDGEVHSDIMYAEKIDGEIEIKALIDETVQEKLFVNETAID